MLFLALTAAWYFLIIPSKRAALTREAKEAAEKEAEVIKQKKLLEVKDKFLSKKAELEKEVRQRNQQIQQAENRAKQRELSLNQKQDELTRRKQETESLRQRVETQQALLQKREEEWTSARTTCWSRSAPSWKRYPVSVPRRRRSAWWRLLRTRQRPTPRLTSMR